MGNLALEQGKSVNDVIADGPGLVFVVFPHALAKMPIPQLWSATFFFMLILLGIDSQVTSMIFIFTVYKLIKQLINFNDKCYFLIYKYSNTN